MQNRKSELVKNTLIIAMGSMSVQLVSFLLLPFYTSHLSPADFGVFDLITTYSMLLGPLVSLQLGMAAFRFLIDVRGDESAKKKIISNVLWLACLPLALFVGIFLLILQFFSIRYGYWMLGTICASISPILLLQIARGFGKNSQFALGSIVSGVITIIFNVVLIASFGMGASGMLLASILGSFAVTIYLFFALRLYRYISFGAGDSKLRKEILQYAWPLVPNGISWWIINAADRTIISIFLGVAANGIYAVAYKFPTVFSTVFSFYNMSWTESASVHINSKDHKDRDKFFSETISASVRFFASLAAVMVAFIGLFFDVFIGENFHAAYTYIPVLLAASFFNSLVGNYSAIYIAKKLTKQVATTTIFAAIINIVLSLVSIKFIGMYGTALATAIAYLTMAIFRHYDTKKYVSITYDKNLFFKVGIFFIFTCALYYYNHLALNIANVVLTSLIALVLNRSFLVVMKEKVFSKLKKLTPDQEVAEETNS